MNDPVLCFLVVNTAVSLGLALGALACFWGRARPSIVHLLWLAALVKLITPSVVPVPMWPAATAATAAAAAGPEIEILAVVPLESGGVSSGAAAPPLYSSKDVVPVVGRSVFLRPWVLGLWAAGSVAWAGLALWRMGRFHRLLRGAQPLDATTPCVFAVEAAISPLLWAFLGRARIVVPKALFNVLSDAEFEAVLCHERAHYRRRDHWVRWIEFAVMSALWWHPLVWWISRRLRAAEEACCDAEVVADLPDRRPYASALLRTALFISESPPLPRTATGIGRPASIQHRVHTIMNAPVPRRLSFGTSSALLAATALVVLASPVEMPRLLPDAELTEETPVPARDSIASTAPEAVLPHSLPPTSSPRLVPEAAPSGQFSVEQEYLSGYMKMQEAKGRKNAGDSESARRLYQEALAIFESVRAKSPAWQAKMVEFRIGLIHKQLGLETPASTWMQGTTIVSPISPTSTGAVRVGLKTEVFGQPWVLVADRLDAIEPDVTPGRSRTMTFNKGEATLSTIAEIAVATHVVAARGSIRAGWGSWQIVADAVELQGATIVFTGNPVLVVDSSQQPPHTIFKGRRLNLDKHDRTLSLVGDAVVLMDKCLLKNDGDAGMIQLTVSPDATQIGWPTKARTMHLNLSDFTVGRERAQLLETWPGAAALEKELAPLLQKTNESNPAVDPSSPVDAPRQEPLPNESTPLKKLPG